MSSISGFFRTELENEKRGGGRGISGDEEASPVEANEAGNGFCR